MSGDSVNGIESGIGLTMAKASSLRQESGLLGEDDLVSLAHGVVDAGPMVLSR